jgi:hypothetical protein
MAETHNTSAQNFREKNAEHILQVFSILILIFLALEKTKTLFNLAQNFGENVADFWLLRNVFLILILPFLTRNLI